MGGATTGSGAGRRWAAATDPSLSWIKLLVSSGTSSSAVTWDQLSSLLTLSERLSLPTNPASSASATAGLSLSLLEGRKTSVTKAEGRSHDDITRWPSRASSSTAKPDQKTLFLHVRSPGGEQGPQQDRDQLATNPTGQFQTKSIRTDWSNRNMAALFWAPPPKISRSSRADPPGIQPRLHILHLLNLDVTGNWDQNWTSNQNWSQNPGNQRLRD